MGFRIKKMLLQLIAVVSAYTLLLPILLLILGINELIRAILRITLYCSRSECELISDGTENLYPTHVGGVGGVMMIVFTSLDTNINLQQERTHWLKDILGKPGPNNRGRMYARLETLLDTKWGYGCRRRDTKFNIDNHVKLWTDSSPSNGEFYTESEFLEEILPKLSINWDFTTKPGWEWVIIPKVQLEHGKNPQSVRVLRVHHSYMDGISVYLLITECLVEYIGSTEHPNKEKINPLILDPKGKLPNNLRNQIRFLSIQGLLLLPYYLMKGLLSGPIPLQNHPLLAGGLGKLKHFGMSNKIPFQTLREIRSKYKGTGRGSSSTNALASIFISAVAKALDEEGKLTDKSELGMYNPAAIFPYKDSRPKSQVLSHPLRLPLRKMRPGEIQHVDVLQSVKYSFPIRHLTSALGRFQQRFWQRVVPLGFAKFPASVGFTCIPASRVKGHLRSAGGSGSGLVSDIGGLAVASNPIGLSVVAMCYDDQISFWCVVDDSVMNKRQFTRFLELLSMQYLNKECV